MINYHPTDKQLQQFAEGNISSALALVVSAHCDVCSQCQGKVDDINIELSSVIENVRAHDFKDPAFEKMLASIMHLPVIDTKPVVAPRIELDGRFFDVPRPLQRVCEKHRELVTFTGQSMASASRFRRCRHSELYLYGKRWSCTRTYAQRNGVNTGG